MKTLNKIIASALIVTFFASCSKSDDLNEESINNTKTVPAEILSYKSQHFPNKAIIKSAVNTSGKTVAYEIDLEDNIALDFNSDYKVTDIEAASELPESVIPQALRSYVAQNYPSKVITDWELEYNHQEIELDNEVDLEFQMDGTFIRKDNNDNETNQTNNTQNIPAAITTYVTNHFPNNSIVNYEEDTDDNTVSYDVTLSGNFELEFNANKEITAIEGTTQLPDSVLQQSILDYVAQHYPSNFVTDWELENNHQEVELNNGIELEFQMDGTFIRVDND